MARTIVVSSNCQTGGIASALVAMLPRDSIRPFPWTGADASATALRDALRSADVWVTAADERTRSALLPKGRDVGVIRVPQILFDAFHPDAIRIVGANGTLLASPVARLHSAIVVWGWRNGLDASDIALRFRPAVMERLGYTSAWDPAVDRLRNIVDATDVDFDRFFLPLRRGMPFMLTINHVRLAGLVSLARRVRDDARRRQASASTSRGKPHWRTGRSPTGRTGRSTRRSRNRSVLAAASTRTRRAVRT